MDFFAHLSLIEDPRSSVNRQHDLVDIMFLVMAAVVSGCEGWQEIEDFGTNKLDWLRKYRPFAGAIPTRHSIARIIRGIAIEPLVHALFTWSMPVAKPLVSLSLPSMARPYEGQSTNTGPIIACIW